MSHCQKDLTSHAHKISGTKMDEIGFKTFHPYNIILVAQFRKKARGNISTCGSHDLGFLDVFLSKGIFPTFGSHKLGFSKVFFSSDVNVFSCLLVCSFEVIPPRP
jgi:hypothetical protein